MISPQDAISLTPPSAWRVVPFWSLFRRTKSIGHADEELLSVYRDHGVVPTSSRDDNRNKPSEDLSGYQLVTEGALVTNKMKAWQGSIAISRHRGIVSPAYYVYQPLSEEHDQFLHYLLRSEPYVALYQRISKGVRVSQWDLEHEALRTIPVLLPDPATQKQIADFLDAETARIDALIEKKLQLIDAAEAEFLERITHAVTGSAWDAGRKPSGYDWHPTVPSSWSVVRLKFLCSKIVDCLHETPVHDDEGEYPSVRTADVKRGKLLVENAKRVSTSEYINRIQRLEPEPGDIVYTREGERFGLAALVPEGAKLCLGQRMMMFRVNRRVVPAYLMWSLNGAFAYNYLKQGTAGATSPHLNIFDIRNVPIFLPPLDVQESICAELEARFAVKEKMIDLVERTIDRLREYRAALITAAVTGQIDVAAHARPVETAPPRASGEVVHLRPVAMPDRRTVRVLVAADVVHRLGADPYLGRTKLQKLMFLAEAHANINDIAGRYQRYRYGPYDDAMVQEIEQGLRQDGYYDTWEGTGVDREKVAFQQMSRAGGHRDALAAALGGKTDSLRQLVDLFKGKDTEATEAVATLYAVWNDALIDGKQPDDAAIIRGFLQDWHPEKGKFKQADLQTWLGWMRRHGLVPKGTGPRTVSTNTPSLFERE
ncbi:MAG: restriction endonuclease subunit S [Rhodobacteraceae bacterium]|nr:restriction endonuclease subunit S [Paracoccaceae bacterium]